MTDTKDAGLVPPEIQYKGPVLKNRLSWALGFFIFFSGATVIFFGIQAALERIHFRQDFQELLYHNRVITLSLKLLSDAKDIETGQRGFLLTDDRSYLEPYQNSRRSVLAHLGMLLSVSRNSPATLSQIETSGQLLAREMSTLNHIILTQEEFGQKKALQIEIGGEPKKRMDELRASVNKTLATQNGEIVFISSHIFRDRVKTRKNFFLFLVTASLFVLISLFVILKEIRLRNRLMKRLEEESTHDALTGLPNRRFLFDWLSLTISQDRNKEFPLLLLFLDLNHFKSVNDYLGHATGDIVLKKTVSRIQSILRTGDLLARLGGDEFIIVIREKMSQGDQERLISRLKNIIEDPPLVPKGFPAPFGLSVGIASFPENGDTAEELLRFADQKMYGDKAGNKQGKKTQPDRR